MEGTIAGSAARAALRMTDRDCPLCGGWTTPLASAASGRFHACPECGLLHLGREHRLGQTAELAHYRTHENDPADPGYRAFLDRLCTPLAERLAPGAEGLDYGAGPGPTLSLMLAERGFPTRIFDPYFAPHADALARSYDFIVCSETAEHFHHPGAEFDRFQRLLRPGGWLGVMTRMPEPDADLDAWWYARDPTHVCFYPVAAMQWIARRFGWALELPAPHVALFRQLKGHRSF